MVDRAAYNTGLAGVAGAAAASSALASGFQNLLTHIDERTEAAGIAARFQKALDEEANLRTRAEADLEEAENEIDRLLDEIARLKAKAGEL